MIVIMIRLGVNIDHVATVRQARMELFPDPVELATLAARGGADGITAHLREDRRHIQDTDLFRIKEHVPVPLNMEMAATPDIVRVALKVKPAWCCIVPEKREELTTEGGLDISEAFDQIKEAIEKLHGGGIQVSLFVDADEKTMELAKRLNADAVEIHTGPYSRSWSLKSKNESQCSGSNLAVRNSVEYELNKLRSAGDKAKRLGLLVNAGHGLDYENVSGVASVFPFHEFNIGFAVVARALKVGMEKAVSEMKNRMNQSICVES